MKLLFKHKHFHNLIVDKDIFNSHHTITIYHYSLSNANTNANTKPIVLSLYDILNSDDWVAIPLSDDFFSCDELKKIYSILYHDISSYGDRYCLGHTLSKMENLIDLYDLEDVDIMS